MKKKSMPYGVYHLLTCVLAVVMAVLAVLVSQRAEEKWYLKLDVSPSGVTNLSDYTLSRLHALDEDVLLYPVYTSGYDSTVRDLVTETLNKMSAECAHVRVETIDPVSACRTRTCSRLSAKATSRLLLLFIALWRLASLLNCGYHTIFSGTCQAKNIGKTIAGHKKGADDPCKRRNHQPKNCFIPPPRCGRRRRGWRTVRPPRRRGWS